MLTRLNSFFRFLRDRHERRVAIRTLSAMDDHQLADIGILRGSIGVAVDGAVAFTRPLAG